MFCNNCGKELNDDAKFCQFCGQKIDNDNKKPEKEKDFNTGCFIAIAAIIFFFIFAVISGSNSKSDISGDKEKCPSVSEMEDAISLYKNGDIIYKFTPELNTVYITPLAEKQFLTDDYRTLGYIAACYSGYIKGNDLYWVEIYSAKTNKKMAKFSKNYGFKMY